LKKNDIRDQNHLLG